MAYVRCPLEVCIQRETKRKDVFYAPKRIYEKAFTRESTAVPGVGVPHEESPHPDVIVDSDKLDPMQCAQKILETLCGGLLS